MVRFLRVITIGNLVGYTGDWFRPHIVERVCRACGLLETVKEPTWRDKMTMAALEQALVLARGKELIETMCRHAQSIITLIIITAFSIAGMIESPASNHGKLLEHHIPLLIVALAACFAYPIAESFEEQKEEPENSA